MSLIRFGRSILRRFLRVPVRGDCVASFQQKHQCVILPRFIRSRFLWSNLESFSYRGAAATLRKWSANNFLRRYATNFGLVSFISIYMHESNDDYKPPLSILNSNIQSNFRNYIQNSNDVEVYPSHLSEYKMGKRLGKKSCCAAVYEAECNGKECAVKVMFNFDVSSSGGIFRAFQREYHVLSKENFGSFGTHPNVIKLLGKFVDKTPELYDSKESYPQALPHHLLPSGYGRTQTLFLVMPKYSCTLREYLRNTVHTLTLENRILILQQLLEGVSHLERNEICHRDLKTDNILIELTQDGLFSNLVITDFGCCLSESSMLLPFETDHVDRGGNMALMSPEIITAIPGKGVMLDYSKADVWAIGTLAYEIFENYNPFYADLCSESYKDNELPSIRTGNDIVDKLIVRLLLRDPDQRPTAQEAATIIFLRKNAPGNWFLPCKYIADIHVERWILELCLLSLRSLQGGISSDVQMTMVFLQRVTVEEIINCVKIIQYMSII